MTRTIVPLLAAAMMIAASLCGGARAQQPAPQQPATAPEPKMPPMPSMEGQQGDPSKPASPAPAKKNAAEKKASSAEKKATATKGTGKNAAPTGRKVAKPRPGRKRR